MNDKVVSKYLAQKSWFHGTTLSELESIVTKGIDVNFNFGVEHDFGYGFYLAPTFDQAKKFIERALKYSKNKDEAIVIEFELCINHWILNGYNIKLFQKYNEEFANFVLDCRMNPNKFNHNYDLILGVMSDNKPNVVVDELRKGIITYENAIELLLKWTSAEQLSLHNQLICDKLRIVKVTQLIDGGDLCVNEYKRI